MKSHFLLEGGGGLSVDCVLLFWNLGGKSGFLVAGSVGCIWGPSFTVTVGGRRGTRPQQLSCDPWAQVFVDDFLLNVICVRLF